MTLDIIDKYRGERMTNEEASIIIGNIPINGDGCYSISEYQQAKARAIAALEQQACEDWYDVPSNEMTLEQARQAVKDLRKKLAEYLEQEPCDMKQRVEKEYLYESLCEDLKKANAEIKRLSEPFEDAISRQAVDELSKELVHTTRDKADFLCNFWEGLQKLPPVTPKEKTGWISVSERLPEDYQRVLVTIVNYHGDKVVRVAEYHDRKRFFQIKENHEQWEVGEKGLLAWMPLPKPYKAESEVSE